MITRQEIRDLVTRINKTIEENFDHEFLSPQDFVESGFIQFLEEKGLMES